MFKAEDITTAHHQASLSSVKKLQQDDSSALLRDFHPHPHCR